MDSILWFEQISIGQVPLVGGKNASLGEMVRELGSMGVRVPTGFATTADAYRGFIEEFDLASTINQEIRTFRDGVQSLQAAGSAIRERFLAAGMPADLADQIRSAYGELCKRIGAENAAVAVRSSATAEDLPDASFAGQQETFLNIRGERALLDACLRCFASLFTDRAISYREAKGFDHIEVALSIGVQQMVRSDLAGSGVAFTIDPETGFPDAVIISAAWGLGETVVQGIVDPDKYSVFKPLLDKPGKLPVIEKTPGAKAIKMVYDDGGSKSTRVVETTAWERRELVLTDDEIAELGRWAIAVERHYGRAIDIEWAKDGHDGLLYLVQARPETVQSGRNQSNLLFYHLREKTPPITAGAAIGSAIAAGKACVIRTPEDIERFVDGAILVTDNTDPDWVPVMKRASGIVTDHGSNTSHAAIVSRELGVPAVVGTSDASRLIEDGQEITISCAEGESGKVYPGVLDFDSEEIDLRSLPKTRTQVMVNIADPATAFRWWQLPAKGVGLARMEFIINTLIKIHPMALIHPERLDAAERQQISKLTASYASSIDYFVDRLARGIAKLAAPYYPHPAIVRLSDFKTNEYAHLLGGSAFEPEEENPMIGFRGASRYYDARYRAGFDLECRAIRRVRETIGFDNVIVMVPFCRTPAEADRVLEVMRENGLERGKDGLQVYMMCEIPSNVILADRFAPRFDGFSIGSNDLTQLTLGIDRDSELLAEMFDARDEAVKRMVAEAIDKCHEAGIKIGICGQAPSDHPDFAAFLVDQGIDSISLNPDSFVSTIRSIASAESAAA